ncbi:EamA family transporter [Parasutterella sp.]|uniref:EamA family transporter n=1 Tax=Parasutterella sp. TaxID=2049037 RepID=UPI00399B01F5
MGLVSAGVGAFATIQPRRAIQKIGVTKVVSFGMFVGGILTCFMTPPWAISGHWTPMAIVAAVFVVVFGTVGAFWCYLRSTEFIPPALTSILASFEPLSAVVLCVLLLGTSFNYVECIGAALIISNLFILSIPNDKFRTFFPRFRRAGLEN